MHQYQFWLLVNARNILDNAFSPMIDARGNAPQDRQYS